jgi:hypothetical protein
MATSAAAISPSTRFLSLSDRRILLPRFGLAGTCHTCLRLTARRCNRRDGELLEPASRFEELGPLDMGDDGRRYSQVPSDFPLPEIVGREESLSDPAVAGLGLLTRDEDVEITLRETATHSIHDLIQDLVLPESATWRAARISSMTLRLPAFAAEASIDFRRNVIEASRALPLRQMLAIAAKFIASLNDDELSELNRSFQSPTALE